MKTEHICPSCRKTLAPDAPLGLCPECLVKAGFPTGTEPDAGAATPAAAPPIDEVRRLFPQLEIIELLGRGGMGVVFKARQPKLDRLVALKLLLRARQEQKADAAFAERFAREARALARLSHPDIVAVYDYGEAGGYPFLIMEYVEGLTLRQLLQREKISPAQALALVPKICEALQFAHQQGVVHRDIKPENILLDTQGRVKIADFGIAKVVGPAAPAGLTQERQVIGTPHYMAPEQIEHPQAVDHRADIFSLGVVFYEMLTGELPLGKFAPPSRKVQVDVRLDEVVLHALEKEPERRYQHVSEVKTDVEAIGKGEAPKVESRHLEATPSSLASKPAAATEGRGPQAPALPEPWWVAATRWTARILGTLWLLMYLVFAIAEGTPSLPQQPVTVQIEFAAVGLMLAGFVAGWWRDGLAVLLTMGGWALFHVAEPRVRLFSMFHFAAVVGVLYAIVWVWRRFASRPPAHGARRYVAEVGAIALFPFLLAAVVNIAPPHRPPQPVARPVASTGSATPAVSEVELQTPPVVVRTVPESGVTGVDPALTELRVTYSKPMQDGDWAWRSLTKESYPETTGKARYLPDGRTCVLPVKLQPGKLYAVWLNVDQFQNFKDRAGHPAVPYLLIFETRK